MQVIEKTYGKMFRLALMFINPFKKAIIKTECEVHQFINEQALEILRNDKYEDAYMLFSDYIYELNQGVVWADQDFKSIGHFYSPRKERGLYGHLSALNLAEVYYRRARRCWIRRNTRGAMFFLGAAVHLIQDMTIPQHVNIRLMDSHRKYETFVKNTHEEVEIYKAIEGGIYLNSIEEFIKYNAKIAIKVYKKFHCVPDEGEKFYRITKYILPLAEKTTAGCLLMFYRQMSKRDISYIV